MLGVGRPDDEMSTGEELESMAADTVLDRAVLARLRRLHIYSGKQILPQLVAAFTQITPPRLVALREAIALADAGALARVAHALKGSSASLGAYGLARLCSDLEAIAEAGHLMDAVELVDRIEAEYNRAHNALEVETWKV